jgi:glucokinase
MSASEVVDSLTIGVDVGGTKVWAGVVDAQGTLLADARRPTPSQEPAKVIETIADLVEELRIDHTVEAVGIGAAGFVDSARSRVRFAPNLAWRDEPLRDEAIERIGLPVVVENDANAMAWAEHRFGAGRGEDNLVCLTIGTGIGGGLVFDGRLLRGAFGIGAEIGHMCLVEGGHECGCGNRGCYEQYGSGRALVRTAREMAALSPTAAGRLLELAGGRIDAEAGPAITAAAHEGDPLAVKCFEQIGASIGRGLASLAAILDPGRFVLGGGVCEAGDLLLDPVRTEFLANLSGRRYRPEADIVLAELGSRAGIIGAADLSRDR